VDPRDFIAWHNLAIEFTIRGKFAEALEAEDNTLRIRPDMIEALVQKGYIDLLQGKEGEAEVIYGEAVRKRADAARLLKQAGLGLVGNGQAQAALSHFTILSRVLPSDAQIWFQLATLQAEMDRCRESTHSYEEAMRLSPEWAAPCNNLAWLLATHPRAECRDGNRAVAVAEKACQLINDWAKTQTAERIEDVITPQEIDPDSKLLRLQGNQDPLQQTARTIIERQVGQLTRIVDDLLEISRISTGRIHLRLERISLGGIVELAIETVRPLIEQRRHTLNVSLPAEPSGSIRRKTLRA